MFDDTFSQFTDENGSLRLHTARTFQMVASALSRWSRALKMYCHGTNQYNPGPRGHDLHYSALCRGYRGQKCALTCYKPGTPGPFNQCWQRTRAADFAKVGVYFSRRNGIRQSSWLNIEDGGVGGRSGPQPVGWALLFPEPVSDRSRSIVTFSGNMQEELQEELQGELQEELREGPRWSFC